MSRITKVAVASVAVVTAAAGIGLVIAGPSFATPSSAPASSTASVAVTDTDNIQQEVQDGTVDEVAGGNGTLGSVESPEVDESGVEAEDPNDDPNGPDDQSGHQD